MIRFSDIFGQDAAVLTLRRAYQAGRLPHGLIFSGPVGVGKATTACALGALFLCEQPKGDEPCGKCASCAIFEAENHPDFHLIKKELIRLYDKTGESKAIDLSIHVIRPELVARASLKPTLGVGKVFVIKQAELMNLAAQNAMLKTLEEPYGRTLIILLTDQPDALLPTIRSRCQLVRFSPLDPATVRQQLEKRGHPPAVAAKAAALADGSLGLALKWLEDGVIESAGALTQRLERLLAGQRVSDLPEWFKSAAEAYSRKQLERDDLASQDQARRQGMALYLQFAANALRQILRDQAGNPDMLDRLCAAIDAIAEAQMLVDANINVALIFQQLAMKLEEQFVPARPGR